MKRTVIVISLLGVGATLLASGCGDDGPITNTPLTLEQYRDEAAALECEFLFSCCDTDERIKFSTSKGYATPLTQAECKATISAYYDQGFLAEMRKSVDLGRIRFDGQSAATCIAKSTITCPGGKFPAQPDECGAIFVGRVADNGACTNGLECSLDSSSCIHVGGSEMGTCKPRVKEGGPCAPDICEDGLVCLIENMQGTCIKLKSIGEACASRHDCDSYYCDTATNLCAPRRLAGESCLADEDCDSILCDPMTKLCTALKAAGAPCTADIECESYMCDMATQSCAAPPPPWCDGK